MLRSLQNHRVGVIGGTSGIGFAIGPPADVREAIGSLTAA